VAIRALAAGGVIGGGVRRLVTRNGTRHAGRLRCYHRRPNGAGR
jgi:hypothetical protein